MRRRRKGDGRMFHLYFPFQHPFVNGSLPLHYSHYCHRQSSPPHVGCNPLQSCLESISFVVRDFKCPPPNPGDPLLV